MITQGNEYGVTSGASDYKGNYSNNNDWRNQYKPTPQSQSSIDNVFGSYMKEAQSILGNYGGGGYSPQKFNYGKSVNDFTQQATNKYDVQYNQMVTNLQNRVNNIVSNLESTIDRTKVNYDDANTKAQQNYSNQTLSRGVGRSSIATTGLSGINVDMEQAKQLALGEIQAKIDAAESERELGLESLANTRTAAIADLAQQMYDRDYGQKFNEFQAYQQQRQAAASMASSAASGRRNALLGILGQKYGYKMEQMQGDDDLAKYIAKHDIDKRFQLEDEAADYAKSYDGWKSMHGTDTSDKSIYGNRGWEGFGDVIKRGALWGANNVLGINPHRETKDLSAIRKLIKSGDYDGAIQRAQQNNLDLSNPKYDYLFNTPGQADEILNRTRYNDWTTEDILRHYNPY